MEEAITNRDGFIKTLLPDIKSMRPLFREMILINPFEFISTLLPIGIKSITGSDVAILCFKFGLLSLSDKEQMKVMDVVDIMIADFDWFDGNDEDGHKAYLLLKICRSLIFEVLQLTPEEVTDKLNEIYAMVDVLGKDTDKYKQEAEVAKIKAMEYFEILKLFGQKLPVEIFGSSKSIIPTHIVSLNWTQSHLLLNDLYHGLLELGHIKANNTSFETFLFAFTRQSTDKASPIHWETTLRNLVYLMDHIASNGWIENANEWQSTIEKAQVFYFKRNPITAKTLSSTKHQINPVHSIVRKPSKEFERIDLLIKKIRAKIKTLH